MKNKTQSESRAMHPTTFELHNYDSILKWHRHLQIEIDLYLNNTFLVKKPIQSALNYIQVLTLSDTH